jgi:hypothetical protein
MLLVPKQRQAIGGGIKEHVKKDENIKKKGLTKNPVFDTMVLREVNSKTFRIMLSSLKLFECEGMIV